MSNEERICLALLGWKRQGKDWHSRPAHIKETRKRKGCAPEVVIVDDYERKGEHDVFVAPDGGEIWVCGCDRTNTRWPDFTTLDGCAEFERALYQRDELEPYFRHLLEVHNTKDQPRYVYLLATPTERVAACIRVLDEAGL